jgi:hypothetical protein
MLFSILLAGFWAEFVVWGESRTPFLGLLHRCILLRLEKSCREQRLYLLCRCVSDDEKKLRELRFKTIAKWTPDIYINDWLPKFLFSMFALSNSPCPPSAPPPPFMFMRIWRVKLVRCILYQRHLSARPDRYARKVSVSCAVPLDRLGS